MPRKGYRSLTLPEAVYRELIKKAEVYGTSSQKLIECYLKDNNRVDVFDATFSSRVKSCYNTCHGGGAGKGKFSNGGVNSGVCEPPTLTPRTVQNFAEFCRVDLRLSKESVRLYRLYVGHLMTYSGYSPTVESVRSYLSGIKNPYTYNTHLKAFRHFFIRFMKRPDLIESFMFSEEPGTIRTVKTREELRSFFGALDTLKDQAMFLLYATSGRRRHEIADLTFDSFNLDQRTLYPVQGSRSKRMWYSFFNDEAQKFMAEYLEDKRPKWAKPQKVFPYDKYDMIRAWASASEKSGVKVTPQDLRFWFCNEMRRLGVQSEYVNAFCGRIPRSVLEVHYTDYSMENLKAIYDKAELKVLS